MIEVQDLTKTFNGKTVLNGLNSHDLDEVQKICSKIAILHRGTIQAYDEVEDLRNIFSNPVFEIILCTTAGRDYHETTAHGMIYNQPLQPLYQQMLLFSDVSRIVRSTELQLTEILDIDFVDMINTHIHQSG